MTVEQPIAALATLSPQRRVIMPGERTDFVDVDAAFIALVRFDGGGWPLTDAREADRTPVVRLFGPEASQWKRFPTRLPAQPSRAIRPG